MGKAVCNSFTKSFLLTQCKPLIMAYLKIFLIVCIFILLVESSVFFGSLVSKSNSKRQRKAAVEFNEYGDVPQFQNAYVGIGLARTVVIVRCNNGTLVSFYSLQRSALQMAVSTKPIMSLGSPQQTLVITGLSGDCRILKRLALQVSLNHTAQYGAPASIRYIAHTLGKFLQSSSTGSARPFICHLFLIDSRASNPCIFEVDAFGGVQQVLAGIAGRGMRAGKSYLENGYGSYQNIDTGRILSRDVLELSNKDNIGVLNTDDLNTDDLLENIRHNIEQLFFFDST